MFVQYGYSEVRLYFFNIDTPHGIETIGTSDLIIVATQCSTSKCGYFQSLTMLGTKGFGMAFNMSASNSRRNISDNVSFSSILPRISGITSAEPLQ